MKQKKLQTLSLPEGIASTLRGEVINLLEPGQRLETEPVLAKRFDCSIGTLRTAVKLLEEDGLVERRQGIGTFVVNQTGKPIAILVDCDISQWGFSFFYQRLMTSLIRYFDQEKVSHRFYLGTRLFSEATNHLSCRSFLHDLSHNKFAGVIEACTRVDEGWMSELRAKELPIVGVYSVENTVSPDIDAAMREGLVSLLDQGCEKVGVLSWGMEIDGWMQRLIDGLVAEMGLDPSKCKLFEPLNIKAEQGWQTASKLARMIKQDKSCDGLIFADEMLLGEIALPLIKLGIDIPKDVKIASVSHKGSGISMPFPLTQLEFDPEAIAQQMGKMLLDFVSGRPVENQNIMIAPKIRERMIVPSAMA